MADWYYTKNGEQRGPVSSAQLRQLAQAGDLQPTDLVFKEGGKEWVAASTIPNLFAGGRASSVKAGPSPPVERRSDREEGALAFEEDEDAPLRRPTRRGSGGFGDFLMFRRMIAPYLIIVLFWLASVGYTLFTLFSAGTMMLASRGQAVGFVFALLSVLGIPVAILLARLYCEVMIIVFRMNETLTDIKNLLEKQNRDRK